MFPVPSQPQMVSHNHGEHSGYIKLSNNNEYFLSTNYTKSPPTITLDKFLQDKLAKYPGKLEELISDSSSDAEFIEQLVVFLEERVVLPSTDSGQLLRLVRQITSLSSGSVKSVGENFQEITLQHVDEGERTHCLSIQLDCSEPRFVCDLPVELEIPKSESPWCCETILERFCEIVGQYQALWDALDDIDTNAWVIEPDPFTRGKLHRRIVLKDGASLVLHIDPAQPSILPRCHFLGSGVQPLQDLLDEHSDEWNSNLTILDNLSKLLELDIPERPNSEETYVAIDCGVCYCYEMGGETPEVGCSNTSCKQLYHVTCLVEWFRGLQNVRQSFGTVFGECPYCSKPMHIQAVL